MAAMSPMAVASYALALVALLGCSENVSSGGPGGGGGAGSGASGGDGGMASGGGGAGSSGSSSAASTGAGTGDCEWREGDPECGCSSSMLADICRCQCGDQVVEVHAEYTCNNVEGSSCADGTGGAGGAPIHTGCEVIGTYKLCGP
jgi:hypothetical protein